MPIQQIDRRQSRTENILEGVSEGLAAFQEARETRDRINKDRFDIYKGALEQGYSRADAAKLANTMGANLPVHAGETPQQRESRMEAAQAEATLKKTRAQIRKTEAATARIEQQTAAGPKKTQSEINADRRAANIAAAIRAGDLGSDRQEVGKQLRARLAKQSSVTADHPLIRAELVKIPNKRSVFERLFGGGNEEAAAATPRTGRTKSGRTFEILSE